MTYQIVVKIPFDAMDDMAARSKAQQVQVNISGHPYSFKDADFKLQEIFPDKAPRGLIIL